MGDVGSTIAGPVAPVFCILRTFSQSSSLCLVPVQYDSKCKRDVSVGFLKTTEKYTLKILNYVGNNTVVNTLVENKLSSRYHEGNWNSASLLYKQNKPPMQSTVTLQMVSTVRGSRSYKTYGTPWVRLLGQCPRPFVVQLRRPLGDDYRHLCTGTDSDWLTMRKISDRPQTEHQSKR